MVSRDRLTTACPRRRERGRIVLVLADKMLVFLEYVWDIRIYTLKCRSVGGNVLAEARAMVYGKAPAYYVLNDFNMLSW